MKCGIDRARIGAASAALIAAGWLLAACDETAGTEIGTDASIQPVGPGAGTGGGSVGAGAGIAGTTGGFGGTTGSGGFPGSFPIPGAGGTTGGRTGGGTTGGPIAGTAGGPTGGTGGTAGGAAGGGGDLPCDIKTIVEQRCGSCHGPTPAGSPMSLATHANWHAPGTTDKTKQYHQLAKIRINAATSPMPPPAIGTLTPEEKQKLNAWLDQGAPPGTTACTGGGPTKPGVIDTTGLDCYKFLAHAQGSKTTKYRVGAAVDSYMNFGFQAPWRGTLYVQVIKPVIDNSQALHHWLLYREAVQDGSITATIGQHAGGELLNGWAPGGDPSDLRTHGDISMELPATTYSIEIHYNSSDPNAQDASGVEVCGKSTPTQNIASLSWLGYDQGGTLSYASGICLTPDTSWTGTCDPGHSQPIHLVTMTPHLHQAGRHLKAVINGPGGQRVLHDKPFDFAYQVTYETHEVLMPGETITTTCTYSEPKCAGQSTTQEMCYLYVLHWPKQTLVDYGIEGTFMHGEGVCLGQ